MKKNSIYAWILLLMVMALICFLYYSEPYLSKSFHRPNGKEGLGEGEERGQDERQKGPKLVHLTAEQMQQFGIVLDTIKPGKLQQWLNLPGEVVINTERVAHIVPRVTGVVSEVRKSLGDAVHKGEVLAVLDSRELADGKAAFLAAQQRLSLAEAVFRREEQLWQKRISAEQEYIQSKNNLAEVQIELQTAEQKLHTLGMSSEKIRTLPHDPQRELTRYEMIAPFDATIVEKHIDLGEVLKDDTPGFKIADLSSVWVTLDVHQRDTPYVRIGQPVKISSGPGLPEVAGLISYIEPMVNEQTRTLHARISLDNRSGLWQPGLFVTGRVAREDHQAAVLVPIEALVLIDGKPHVFLQVEGGLKAHPVQPGKSNDLFTEILDGLSVGQRYVARGTFTVKSEWDKPQNEE